MRFTEFRSRARGRWLLALVITALLSPPVTPQGGIGGIGVPTSVRPTSSQSNTNGQQKLP